MAFISKKRKAAEGRLEKNKAYSLKEASTLVKQVNTTKFDASVDLHVRLGVDPKKADQAIRGTVTLPHGTGKTKKVLVLSNLRNRPVNFSIPSEFRNSSWKNVFNGAKTILTNTITLEPYSYLVFQN